MKTKMTMIFFNSGNPSLSRLITAHFRSYATASFHSNSNNNNNNYDEFDDSVARLEELIHKRCRSGNLSLDEALGYFDSLIRSRPLPSIWAFNHLLGTLSKKNKCYTVVSIYKDMMGCLDLRPDVCTFTTVIKCLCHMKKVDLGFPLLATLYKHGLQPNNYTLNTLLHGLCTQG